jgi:BASS family bile acid:Na+ symporter
MGGQRGGYLFLQEHGHESAENRNGDTIILKTATFEMMKKLCQYLSEYMGVLVLAAALLALIFPNVLQQIRPTFINYLLGVVMFGMGLTLNLTDFKIVFSRPKDVITGCLAQFTIMPLLAWVLATVFRLDEALALGVVLVGCCPGGTASNVITYLAKGDLALSVGMTGVSTLLAPLLTPLLTWALAGKTVDVDVAGMLLSILWVVILPIVVGLTVKWIWPKFTEKATDYLPAVSSIAIALIVAIVIGANASKLMAGGLVIVVVVVLHNLCGLSLGYLIGRMLGLSEPKKRAISIEVGMQNSGLASSLATIHFAAYPLATIPGAIFSVWHNISGALMAKVYGMGRQDSQA